MFPIVAPAGNDRYDRRHRADDVLVTALGRAIKAGKVTALAVSGGLREILPSPTYRR